MNKIDAAFYRLGSSNRTFMELKFQFYSFNFYKNMF